VSRDCIRAKNTIGILTATAVGLIAFVIAGCDTSLGVVGSAGLTDTGVFSGITNANVLSPTTARVTWNTASQYNTYQVYSSAQPFPLGNTIFSSYTITGLSPNTTYSFSVGGVNTTSGAVDGLSANQTLQTWPLFTGITQLAATSPISLQATWAFNDPTGAPITGPTFNVYVNQGSPPTDFSVPAISTTANTIGITQLANGSAVAANATYYVVVRATYLDSTSEFNQNALSVTTPSNISPLPTITTDPVIIGPFPNLTVSGGLSGYVNAFNLVTYPSGPTGPTGTHLLGTITGNATFRSPSSQPINWNQNTIIPSVTYQGSTVNLPAVNVVSRQFIDKMVDLPALYAVTGPSGKM
jgi:hypothetical protein